MPFPFRQLAAAFAELEATSSRLAAVAIVARLLGRVPRADLPRVTYLLQGQLRPPFDGVEIGTGERLLTRAIAAAYGVSEAVVRRGLTRAGDLGSAAEALAGGAPRPRLSVAGVYAGLLAVARSSGPGAIDRKVDGLARLLRRADPAEARSLVRIAQGRLRLGVGDSTLLEAAALAALGDRRRKPVLEHAYNVRSDLGEVVRLAFARGTRGLSRIAPRVGVPVRPALAQRLRSARAIVERLGTVQAEPKYDGLRVQVHRDGDRVRIFTRRLADVSAMFPELEAGVRRQLRPRRAILEGEAIAYDPATGRFLPFQVTITRKRRHGVTEAAKRHPLRLFAFDLLAVNGRDCLKLPLAERRRRLEAALRATPEAPVAVAEALVTDRVGELEAWYRTMLRRGLEGIVAKRPDAPYRAGARGYDWIKLKRVDRSRLGDTVDLALVGYLEGRGRRAALGIGSLLAAAYDPEGDRFRTVAKIGSGPSDAEWRALRAALDRRAVRDRPRQVESRIVPDVWSEPRLVVEVLADEITRSPRHTCGAAGGGTGYALRFPRLLGIRRDKSPEDATTEREILDLYRLQRRRQRGARR